MGMPEGKRIFISYARKDGAELAQRLQKDLAGEGFKPWLDTHEIAGGDSWTDDIEGGIDGADAILALLTPGSHASRICRAEQLRALRKDKLVIPLLAKTASDIPLHLEPSNYCDFTGVEPYEKQFQILLQEIGQARGGAKLKAEYRSIYVTAPPLPLNFVPRPNEQQTLRQFVMASNDGIGVALTALEGMGGIGKTILAQSLCHDEAIQQAFPDGVLWVTAGQKPVHSLQDRINEIRSALRDQPALAESELACINRYRSLLHDKAVLLVVDDIWRVADVEPFLVESARSCVLFTTRDTSIAASLGARECQAGLLTPEKSRELLARFSGVALRELPHEAELLIEQCGRLPLALAMVGAMLRGRPLMFWQHILMLLHSADLGKIRAQFPNYPHADLLRCIQVSVNALGPEQRESYLALAVMLEGMAASRTVLQVLWNATPGDALDTAEQFIGLSLAQREGEGIRLHDLQLDYVRAQFPDREALDLVHQAIRLSAHIITRDPDQFASQMVGRLLPHHDRTAIKQFAEKTAHGATKPWLRPLHATLHPPGSALVRTLQGHTDRVRGVALNGQGHRAVSASWDRTLKVWDVETGHEIHTLQGHANRVSGVALNGAVHRAVSASWDQTLKVWDVETGHEIHTLQGHANHVNGVALSGDGRLAVSASADRTLKVWDVEAGRELRTLQGHTNSVNGVALSEDGRLAVSASWDHTLKVWDVETGGLTATFTCDGAAYCCAFITDDQFLAGDAGGHVHFLRLEEPKS
jgi:NB-ARC domain/TIR domain/WD domain, G-beta repeat